MFRWAYQWKMPQNSQWSMPNLDASKLAQEILFSRKASATNHRTIYFNNVPVKRENIQKHLGLFSDSKLSLFDHINEEIKKATKGVNVIRKMNLLLPRFSLQTIYKSFARPHVDYDYVSYEQ